MRLHGGKGRSFWRLAGQEEKKAVSAELELFFSFPLHPIGRQLAASLPKWAL